MYRKIKWLNLGILLGIGLQVLTNGNIDKRVLLLNLGIFGIATYLGYRNKLGYLMGDEEEKLDSRVSKLFGEHVYVNWREKGSGKIEVVSNNLLGSDFSLVVGENYVDKLMQMTDKEFKSVVLHELGHVRRGHVGGYWVCNYLATAMIVILLSGILSSWLIFVVMLGLLVGGYAEQLVGGLYWLSLLGVFVFTERIKEYEADGYVKEKGLGEELCNVLVRFPVQEETIWKYYPSIQKRLYKLGSDVKI